MSDARDHVDAEVVHPCNSFCICVLICDTEPLLIARRRQIADAVTPWASSCRTRSTGTRLRGGIQASIQTRAGVLGVFVRS